MLKLFSTYRSFERENVWDFLNWWYKKIIAWDETEIKTYWKVYLKAVEDWEDTVKLKKVYNYHTVTKIRDVYSKIYYISYISDSGAWKFIKDFGFVNRFKNFKMLKYKPNIIVKAVKTYILICRLRRFKTYLCREIQYEIKLKLKHLYM